MYDDSVELPCHHTGFERLKLINRAKAKKNDKGRFGWREEGKMQAPPSLLSMRPLRSRRSPLCGGGAEEWRSIGEKKVNDTMTRALSRPTPDDSVVPDNVIPPTNKDLIPTVDVSCPPDGVLYQFTRTACVRYFATDHNGRLIEQIRAAGTESHRNSGRCATGDRQEEGAPARAKA